MSDKLDVLAIDDDKFLHKVISKSLNSALIAVRTADTGEIGLELAIEKTPDVILLDVEMPGMNGYEVCERLRTNELTKEVPIIFLSSRSSLRERMQGYEAGGDDYLVKPFEAENLVARITILKRFNDQRIDLKSQLDVARKTAFTAMSGSSDLGQALQFLEKSIIYNSLDEVMDGLFETTERLNLNCCAMITTGGEEQWLSPQEVVSPIEKELIEMSDRNQRFIDFGQRTMVNYPLVTLLVRNMPLDDQDLYGRLKDVIPILLSAVNVKLSALDTRKALTKQSDDMMMQFASIRQNLFHMGKTIIGKRDESLKVSADQVQDLRTDLFKMGLEDDQEDYLVERVDNVVDDVMDRLDSGEEFRNLLSFISTNLKVIVEKQEELLESYNSSQVTENEEAKSEDDDDVVLF